MLTLVRRLSSALLLSVVFMAAGYSPIFSAQEPANEAPHVVVFCPQRFVEAIRPWIEFRTQQGYAVDLVIPETLADSNAPAVSPDILRQEIRRLAQEVPVKSLILVGPARAGETAGDAFIPSPLLTSLVTKDYGPEEPIASDTWYADLNDDGWPEISIGRLPARTPQELASVVTRILAYETTLPAGPWQRHVNLVAGMGGFTAIIDKTVEMVVRRIFFDAIQSDLDLAITQANWKSPFCPSPPQFSDVVTARISEGSLFFIYLGHGLPEQFDYVPTPVEDYPIFDITDVANVRCVDGPPIALLFSCYGAACDLTTPSVGESLFLSPTGPIAVLSGTRVTMPYGMAALGIEMLTQTSQAKGRVRSHMLLGDVILEAKRKMVIDMEQKPSERQDEEKSVRTFVDDTARIFDPSAKRLDEQLLDHVHLMTLLGDPLLRIRFPDELQVTAPETVYAGESITVTATFPAGQPTQGEYTGEAELVLGPGRTAASRMSRKEYKETDDEMSQYQETYLAANDRLKASVPMRKSGQGYTATITVPDDCFGPHTVRVLLTSGLESGSGSQEIHVRAAKSR
ncbi:MAG: C25 family cysteine peptidase [Planctomycetia bacterium]|nr:C25 family cysteine peptidase [Planctomycetia bacterium]